MSMIREPHSNDVLSGRGAGITKHPGNKRWREFIRINRPEYTALPRNQRPQIAERIVRSVRTLTPPGRFLTKDPNTQLWYDIGDDRAVEKTAQAMRDSKKTPSSSKLSPPSSPPIIKKNNDVLAQPPPQLIAAVSSDVVPVVATNTAPLATTTAAPFPTAPSSSASPTKLERPTIVTHRLKTDESLVHRLMESLEYDEFLFFDKTMTSAEEDEKMLASENENHDNKDAKNKVLPPPPPPPRMPLKKPSIVSRNNTFDMRLEQMSFHSLRDNNNNNNNSEHYHNEGRTISRDSIFSFQSFDMLEEEEFEMLEESCGVPSQRMSRQSFRMPNFTTNNDDATAITDNENPQQQQQQQCRRVSQEDKIPPMMIVQQQRISRQSRNQFYADVQCIMRMMEEDNNNIVVDDDYKSVHNNRDGNYFQQHQDDVVMEDATTVTTTTTTTTTAMMRPSIRYTKRSDPYNRAFNNSF